MGRMTEEAKQKKINVGCGITKFDGYIRCDRDARVEPEFCFDAGADKWPFEDDSIDEVMAENLIEHIKDLDHFMSEAWRVLKNDGKLNVLTPYYRHKDAYSDPDHIRFITEDSFIFYCRECKGSDGRPVVRGDMDFKIEHITYIFDRAAAAQFPEALRQQTNAGRYYMNVVEFIKFEMLAVKPARDFTGKFEERKEKAA
jgi:SAM-dependent methyltransferase